MLPVTDAKPTSDMASANRRAARDGTGGTAERRSDAVKKARSARHHQQVGFHVILEQDTHAQSVSTMLMATRSDLAQSSLLSNCCCFMISDKLEFNCFLCSPGAVILRNHSLDFTWRCRHLKKDHNCCYAQL